MKKSRKTIAFILIIALLTAFIPSGCGATMDASVYAMGFLNCISNKDYNGAFDRTYPYAAELLKKDEFVKKYTDIVANLKITSITISDGKTKQTTDGYTYTYKAKYVSQQYGTFINTFTMQLKPYENALRVDWNPNLIFPMMDFGDRVVTQTLRGNRGEIFSADGELLAKNDYAETVIVDLTKAKDYAQFGDALAAKLGIKTEDIKKKFDAAVKNGDDTLAVKAYPKGTFSDADIKDLSKITGVSVDMAKYSPLRYYSMKQAAAHIVGYTGTPDDKEAKAYKAKGIDPSTLIGRYGLEKQYDEQMRPSDGEAVYVKDQFGSIKATLYKKDAVNGDDLRLTINAKLQQQAYNLIANNLVKGQSGAVIVMNADTGFVEAAVSYPSFDDNIFNFKIDKATWQTLQDKESNTPLLSRLTQGLYPPGSAIKPFTAAAALEAKAITTETKFPEEARIKDDRWTPSSRFGTWVYPPIKRKDSAGSPIKLENALIHSDNIYFAYAALLLGKDNMVSYLKKYTFGQPMSFDLPLATSNIKKDSSEFTIKLLADMGYGQGELLVTPMQLAAMYTAFSENGNVKQPVLVSSLNKQNGLQYDTVQKMEHKTFATGIIQQSTVNTLLPIMEKVVTEGTAKSVRINGVRIAGKTGTAQVGPKNSREISWFVGFWMEPKGNERRLVLVMVDVKEGDGPVKFKIARPLLQQDDNG